MHNSFILDLLLFGFVAEEIKNNTIDRLRKNIDALDKNNSGEVDVTLTRSEVTIFFVKVKGKWGAMADNGDWSPLENIDLKTLTEMEDITDALVEKEI